VKRSDWGLLPTKRDVPQRIFIIIKRKRKKTSVEGRVSVIKNGKEKISYKKNTTTGAERDLSKEKKKKKKKKGKAK